MPITITEIFNTDLISESLPVINGNFENLKLGIEALNFSDIGGRNASLIQGLIVASQIGSIHASTITGSILASQIDEIQASQIAGLIQASQIDTVTASQIVGQVQASQIDTVTASQISGQVQASQIGGIHASVINGVIVTSQLVDGILDSLSKFGNNLRPIEIIAAAPALPNSDYPIGSSIYLTSLSGGLAPNKVYRNTANTWVANTEASDITGQLVHSQIASVQASVINGLIVASQIGSVNANTINGQIEASQIGSVSALVIQGTIVASQIAGVHASVIQGSLVASQIASVQASTIQGSIVASQIGSIIASTITIGTLQASQIGSVDAATITLGVLDVGRLGAGSIDVTKLTLRQIYVSGLTLGTSGSNVTWSACTLYYDGTAYSISSGSTSSGHKFIYWVGPHGVTPGSTSFSEADSYASNEYTFLIATNSDGTPDVAWNKLATKGVQEDNLSFSLLVGQQIQPPVTTTIDSHAGGSSSPVSVTLIDTTGDGVFIGGGLLSVGVRVVSARTHDAFVHLPSGEFTIEVDGRTAQKIPVFDYEEVTFNGVTQVLSSKIVGDGSNVGDTILINLGIGFKNRLKVFWTLDPNGDSAATTNSSGDLAISLLYSTKTN